MSKRGMARARSRAIERQRRRGRRLAATVAVAAGAGTLAPAAQAGNYTVTTLVDGPPDPCGLSCTLRDAIAAGATDGTPDVITFASGLSGTIELSPSEDTLDIYAGVDLRGPGANRVTVDGNGTINPFYVYTDEPVKISGLTVTGGRNAYGGGLYAYGADDLTLERMTFTANSVSQTGGAVYAKDGDLTVRNSTFGRNSSAYAGGAIAGPMRDLDVRDSRFTGNRAGGDGGAIHVSASTETATVSGSTFDRNSSADDGGALFLYGPEEAAWISNSTITGNTGARGAGIANEGALDAAVSLENSTVTGNRATEVGGGLYRTGAEDPGYARPDEFTVLSSIVAGNTAPVGTDLGEPGSVVPPVSGAFKLGYSLIGSLSGAKTATTHPNVVGKAPQLGPLRDNLGPTPTMLPLPGSPAIDAGAALLNADDQRGLIRTIDQPGVPDASDGTDIGAVERDRVLGVEVSAKPKQRQRGRKIAIKVKAGALVPAAVTASGTVAAGKKRFALKPVTAEAGAQQEVKLTLKPAKRAAAGKIHKAIDRKKKVSASISVTLSTASGATETTTQRVKLK